MKVEPPLKGRALRAANRWEAIFAALDVLALLGDRVAVDMVATRVGSWIDECRGRRSDAIGRDARVVDVADVGPLPKLPPPKPGEGLFLRLADAPPEKTVGRSMRNVASSQRARFMALRHAAIMAMAGRKWYEEAVAIELRYRAPTPPSVLDRRYLDNIMDTLGGSHGPTFIYLPIVYLDDCQVADARVIAEVGSVDEYELDITFL